MFNFLLFHDTILLTHKWNIHRCHQVMRSQRWCCDNFMFAALIQYPPELRTQFPPGYPSSPQPSLPSSVGNTIHASSTIWSCPREAMLFLTSVSFTSASVKRDKAHIVRSYQLICHLTCPATCQAFHCPSSPGDTVSKDWFLSPPGDFFFSSSMYLPTNFSHVEFVPSRAGQFQFTLKFSSRVMISELPGPGIFKKSPSITNPQ